MNICVKTAYRICFSIIVFMLAFFWFHEDTDEFILSDEAKYSILTDYNYISYEDEASPTGITQEYSWTLHDIPKRNGAVAFYVVHQSIEVYADDELLYSIAPSKNNFFSKGVGCNWAKAYIYPPDNGKELRIVVHPLYETSISNKLTIYCGNFDAIRNKIIRDNAPIMFISFISIVIGILITSFVIFNRRKPGIDTNIAMLGIFSISTGCWKLSDTNAAPLLFGNPLLLSAVTLISLPVMTVSYVLFLRNQFAKHRHKFWDMVCTVCCLSSIVIVVLQLTGIADLRQSLLITHVMVVLVCIIMLFMLLGELVNENLSLKFKITLICYMFCLFGTIIDLLIYCITGHSNGAIFGILAFLAYTVIIGYFSLREAIYLIRRGKEANHYEQLALHDQLTGLYSRVFLSQYVEKHKTRLDNCFIIMLDVNNLKQCNDTMGHYFGDRLLCNSAHLLEQTFLPDGNCIRLGGDEFCVLFRQSTENEIENYLLEFSRLIRQFNESHADEFPIDIAYGYAYFDSAMDSDLNATLNRADHKMYKMKNEMKKQNTSSFVQSK